MMRGIARMSGSAFQDRFRFSGGLAHVNVTRGVDGDDDWRNTSGQVWGQYFLRSATSVSARFWGNDTLLAINNNPAAVPLSQLPSSTVVPAIPGVTFVPNVNDPDRRRASNFGSTLLTLNHTATPWANLRVNWQHLQSQRDDQNGPAGTGFQPIGYRTVSGFKSGIDTVQARVDLTPARWQQIAVGYEFERETFESPSFDENPVEARRVNANALGDQRSNALFVQSQTRLLKDRLILGASGRAQFFSLSRPTFTGGFPTYNGYSPETPPDALTGDGSIAYFVPRTGTKFRAHVGNSYRAPSLYERFGTFFFGGAFSALGDPRLAPERSIAVDGGVDQYLFAGRMRLGATYFYTRLQRVIGFGNLRNDPFGRFSGYVNTDGALARGVEISGETKPWRGMNLSSSYTYINADERRSSLIGGSLRSIRVFPHAFTLVAMQQIGRRTNVTFDFLGASDYVSGSFFVGGGSRPFLFPGPRRGNLAVGYTVPITDRSSVQFFTRVENVFNQEYFEDGFRTPKAWAVGGMKWKF
jgi:iron complex outermembrane receptor protein